MKTKFTKYLFRKFLDWQTQEGVLKTQKEFAEHLGIGYIAFNQVFTGERLPSKSIVKKLAEIFNDEDIYDLADMVRPDPMLKYVQRNWGKLDEQTQHKITDLLKPFTDEPYPENGENETTQH